MPPVRPVILLVEDHQDTRQMYAEFLSCSFEVLAAADSNAALEILKQSHRPDDHRLSHCRHGRLRAGVADPEDPALGRIPIICLSGYGGHAHEVRAREAGCDRILQKPCMPDALAEIALELLLAGAIGACSHERTVFIVEDEIDTREMLEQFLATRGYGGNSGERQNRTRAPLRRPATLASSCST